LSDDRCPISDEKNRGEGKTAVVKLFILRLVIKIILNSSIIYDPFRMGGDRTLLLILSGSGPIITSYSRFAISN